MNFDELIHNKKLMYGVGVASAVGAYALYTRKKKGGSAGAPDATSAAAPAQVATGYLGGINTTGTDVASWLGNYSGSLQNQLDAYSKDLHGSLDALQKMPTQAPAQAPALRSVAVKTGQHLDSLGVPTDTLFKLNPGLSWPRITEATNAGFVGPGQHNVPGSFPVFASDQYVYLPG